MRNILNIAHRGFHKAFPDNTLEAFEAAIQLGVNGIEFDVQETADNGFVVFHDDKLEGKDITKLFLAEVKNIKLQDKFEIPTLEQALDLCRKQVKLLVVQVIFSWPIYQIHLFVSFPHYSLLEMP